MAIRQGISPEEEDPNNVPGPANPPAFPARPSSPRRKRLEARFQWEADDLELVAEGEGPVLLPSEPAPELE